MLDQDYKRGLVGLAFHPDYVLNGGLFVGVELQSRAQGSLRSEGLAGDRHQQHVDAVELLVTHALGQALKDT